jgi:hypothetical protein
MSAMTAPTGRRAAFRLQPRSAERGCGVHEREWEPAMSPVDRKVGIQGQDTMVLMDLRHANDTGICQRHRGVAIFSQQPVQHADMLFQPKRHRERTI